jgi:hypothetical protein
MPKKNIDYSKTVIYKIVCNDLNITDLYVGHTTDFIKRKYAHKKVCNTETDKGYNFKIYKMIRDNGGWDNWAMIEIEKYSCNDRNESHARERYWYEELNANMNSNIPNRINKEWFIINKDKQNKYCKEYSKINKDKLKLKREINKEKYKEYQKKYRESKINNLK